jgi:hypothetical protein
MSSVRTLAVALSLVAAPAAAQDINADPNYGTVELESGFTPDPHVVALRAGGTLPASRVRSDCRGFITDAPDVRLDYDAGTLPLIISVAAASDTTLVINGPDGTWHCDDDGGETGLNPSIRFNNPRGGRYEIWVGTYRAGASQAARLHISEVRSQ